MAFVLVFNLLTVSYLPAATAPSPTQTQQGESINKIGATAFAVVLLIVGITGIVLGGMSSWVDYIKPNKKTEKKRKAERIEELIYANFPISYFF